MDSYKDNEAPRLCARGCGFFGSAANHGLCSKCYAHYLKQNTAELGSSVIESNNDEQFATDPIEFTATVSNLGKLVESITLGDEVKKETVSSPVSVVKKNRCGCCNRKVGLLGFTCRCGGTFCGMHRYPEAHPCTVDFKAVGKMKIEKENPLCLADKMTDRI